MLGVFPNSAPDRVNKGLGLTPGSTKEGLEFFPDDKNVSLILHLLLVLLLAKHRAILDDDSSKWQPILTLGPGDGKMVLTLLEKVIALQVSFTPLHVCKSGLEKSLIRAFVLLRYKNQRKSRRSRIPNGPDDLLEFVLWVLGYRRQNRNDRQSNSKNKGTWHGKGIIALGEGSASELIFAAKRKILRRNAASGGLSHYTR